MFLFETMDNALMPNREGELIKLRQPPYDTMSGMEHWAKQVEGTTGMMKISAWIFILLGLPFVFMGFGIVMVWFGLYKLHAVKRLRQETIAVLEIRRQEILNMRPQGRILEHD